MKRFVSKCLNKARAAMTRAAGEKGFTLVELVVVIAILGILAGVGVVGYSGYVLKANMAADEALLRDLNTAFAVACIENGLDGTGVDAENITVPDGGEVGDSILEVSEPEEKADAIEEDFGKLFEGGKFKVFFALKYNEETGMFEGVTGRKINLTDEQKVSFLHTLRNLLNPGGKILIGDVAFEDRAKLEQCRDGAGDEWDPDEIYFVADELQTEFPSLVFHPVSFCAGVISLT